MALLTIHDIHRYEKMGDPLADTVVDYLYQHQLRATNIWALVQDQARLGSAPCAALYEEISHVPSWVNWAQIEHGAHIFLRSAPVALAAFTLGALPLTYAPPNIARVLASTRRLEHDVIRRLYETGSMVAAVLAKDALKPNGTGVNAIMRVRLMHTFVRRHVSINDAKQGLTLPLAINQAEMAWVACGFSHVVLNGMQKLGVNLNADDCRAYHHLWRYANYLMGVPDALLTSSPSADALRYQQLKQALCAPDDCSRKLTAALHQGLAGQAPFYLPQRTLEALSLLVIDDAVLSQPLGIPERMETQLLPLLSKPVYAASSLARLMDNKTAQWGRQYLHYVLEQGLQGRMADFQMQMAH